MALGTNRAHAGGERRARALTVQNQPSERNRHLVAAHIPRIKIGGHIWQNLQVRFGSFCDVLWAQLEGGRAIAIGLYAEGTPNELRRRGKLVLRLDAHRRLRNPRESAGDASGEDRRTGS